MQDRLERVLDELVQLTPGATTSPASRAMRSSSSGRRWPSPSGCAIFAVAATLATQAFCTPAAAVGGIYRVLMLIAGAIVAAAFQLRGPP